MGSRTRLLILALTPLCLPAQETRSMIFGRVLDPSEAPVAGVAIGVTNTDTNTTVHLKTNQTGYYEAGLLMPGTYTVSAEIAGFKRSVRQAINLPVGSRREIEMRLEIGAVTEAVAVTAEAPLLETSSVSAGRVIDNRSLSELPVLSNSPILLAKFSPGISFTGTNRYLSYSSQDGASGFSSAGNVGGNDFTIDGAPNQSHGRAVGYIPHTDTLLEFKVETAGFDASIGATTGANVAMMTKAGTNQYHGALSWMHWQQRWAGTPFFTRQLYFRRIIDAESKGDMALADQLRSSPRQPTGHSNNYAAIIGGPVVIPKLYDGRNKLFVFFSYSGFKDRKPAEGTPNRTVPTMAQRQGDLSDLLQVRLNPSRFQIYDPLSVRPDPARPGHVIRTPITGNLIPRARLVNPTFDSYLKFLPTPNNPPAATLEPVNNYLAYATPYNWDYQSISNRVDYHYSERHRFFFRWSWYDYREDRNDWTYETARGLSSNGLNRVSPSATADWVFTPRPSTVLNLSLGLNHFYETELNSVIPSFKPSDVGLPKYLDDKAGALQGLPQMNFDGYASLSLTLPYVEITQTLAAKANATHIRGQHTFQAGFDTRLYSRTGHDRINSSSTYTFDNQFTRQADDNVITPAASLGHSWAAYLMGLPSGMRIDTADSFALRHPYFGWFAQDNWRLTPKLALTLGLRMEYELGAAERYNRAIGTFLSDIQLPVTAGAQAAYARAPVPELPASGFRVLGGSSYPGVQGQGQRLWNAEFMLLPRVAAAYQLNSKTVLRAGFGTFYDTYNVLHLRGSNDPEFQRGFFRTTSTTVSDDFGATWLVGNPRNGVSPLRDPFPVRADGSRFDQPPRESLGAMAVAGRSFTYNALDLRHARQQRWRVGIQRQFGSVLLLDIGYAGTYSDRVYINQPMNPLPERFWAGGLKRDNSTATNLNSNVTNPFYLGNFTDLRASSPAVYQEMSTNSFFTSRTIRKDRLLRAYPHLTGLTRRSSPTGEVRTDALEATLQRRFSRGFNLSFNYTWLRNRESDVYLNEFDPSPTWRTSNDGRPHRVVATGIYELPFGKGRAFARAGVAGALLGGWQLGATYEYQPGPLLDWGNLFYYGAEPSAVAAGDRTLQRWFNTDQFERVSSQGPASFHRRVFPTRIDGLRQASINTWNGNFIREIRFKENLNFQLRMDVINLANHSEWGAPDRDPFSSNFGRITSTTASQKRFFQIQGKFRF